MEFEQAKRMVRELRQVEEKYRGERYNTFDIRIDEMARDSADMIVALFEELEKTCERLRVVALEDLGRINYLNLQLETERQEMKYIKQQLKDREDVILQQSLTIDELLKGDSYE